MVPTMKQDIHIHPPLLAELEFLCRFDLNTRQTGVKVHHDAPKEVIDTAKRLHQKALITQPDGGYLTTLGLEAAERIQQAIALLNVK